MGPEEVARRFNVSRESLAKLTTHVELVTQWNAKVNLVAPGTIAEIWWRHVADSLQLRDYLPQNCGRIADLGSGAGFPGLTLAIATGIPTVLIESNGKKAAFLAEAIRRTGAPAEVHHGRIEDIAVSTKADVVTARALAPLSKLIALAFPLMSRGAIGLFLKGQDVEAELTESIKSWRMKFRKYPSVTDPHGVILVVEEAQRVESR